jgi:hypothetical protein
MKVLIVAILLSIMIAANADARCYVEWIWDDHQGRYVSILVCD